MSLGFAALLLAVAHTAPSAGACGAAETPSQTPVEAEAPPPVPPQPAPPLATERAVKDPLADPHPHLVEMRRGRLTFTAGGELDAGFRNIQADRATGNEASMYYKLDLFGEARFDEEVGARLRMLFRTPVGDRARNYELYDELNDQFELRELTVFAENATLGRLSVGKLKLPLGPGDFFEDEPWNQPLLEYYITRTGNYDVGARWDRNWFDGRLSTAVSVTGGNTGALDTNSAVALAGHIAASPVEGLALGVWGKLNKMDTTPIKRQDDAGGLFARVEYRNWTVIGKCAWLRQGLRDTGFSEAYLLEHDYSGEEIDQLVWLRDNGGGKRTITGWYALICAPTIRDLPVFGRRLARIDLFAHAGQIYDPADPFERSRERLGAGTRLMFKDTGTARLYLATGATFDNDTSNTRPYLDRFEQIDERNSPFTCWMTLTLSF